jgi:hypothetical protein
VVVASTLGLTVFNLLHVNLGFTPQGVLIVPTDFAMLHEKGRSLVDIYRQICDHILATPGIEGAIVAGITPLGGEEHISSFTLTSADPVRAGVIDSEWIVLARDILVSLERR